MKKVILSLTLASFLFQGTVIADEVKEESRQEEAYKEEEAVEIDPSIQPAATMERKPKNDTTAQNWIFAAGVVLSATIGIVIVSLNQGASPPSPTLP